MAFIGMRGTGDWSTAERPYNWRQKVLYLYPEGDAPLTAILSMMKSESVDDPRFYWFDKTLAGQRSAVTNVYTDTLMTTAYTTGGAAGDTLYVKVAAAYAKEFRPGHQVLLINSANYADNTNAKVTAVTLNGDDSKITVKLLQADPTTTGIAECNTILIIGNMNPEGGTMPRSIAYDPSEHYNYTQIFRTSLSISRTARKTRLRTYDQYKEAKRESLEMHSIEMEKAFMFGIRTLGTGDNGLPERTTGGLIQWIVDNSGVVSDFSLDSDFDGVSWLDGGEEWLDYQIKEIFKYGGGTRTAFCGSGVILAINKLVKELGSYDLVPGTMEYGIKVTEWMTPFGTINLKTHPLFSYETVFNNTCVIFNPADITYKYIDDTMFYGEKEQQNTGRGRIDGTDEEWLTECGLEFHHPQRCAYLNGFGTDNAVG